MSSQLMRWGFLACAIGACPVWVGAAAPDHQAAAETPAAADPAWEALAASERQYQKALCELLASKQPPLKALFEANRDLRLALLDRKALLLAYARAHRPEQIVRDQGAEVFLSRLDEGWTEEDVKALKASSADWMPLDAKIKQLKSAIDNDPKLADGRKALAELQGDPAYERLAAERARAKERAGNLLKGR